MSQITSSLSLVALFGGGVEHDLRGVLHILFDIPRKNIERQFRFSKPKKTGRYKSVTRINAREITNRNCSGSALSLVPIPA